MMLRDPRIDRLASVLLRHSLALEKGEIFQINASLAAKPLVEALYRESALLGVFPIMTVSLLDYEKLYQAELMLARRLEACEQVRILAPDTDLTFSIRGMPAVCCYGRRNVPDGEVYTAPVRDSASGLITYNVDANYWGMNFKRIRLEFAAGKIVRATCDGDNAALNRIFDTDEGARHIGEFSFGVNPLLTRPTGSTLFDEKITGSLHLTPGNAYAKADNGNKSLIHWDLIQIQQQSFGGGEVWLDGELIRKDGLFVSEDLSGLNPQS